MFLFLALLVLPVGVLLSTDKPRLQVAMNIWPLFIGPVLFAVFAVPYINWRTRTAARRLLGEGRNEGFYGECEVILEPEGIRETRPSGSTTRNWSAVERVAVTPQHLFVYTSGIEAFVVPRRAFDTDADFSRFASAIAERSGSAIEYA